MNDNSEFEKIFKEIYRPEIIIEKRKYIKSESLISWLRISYGDNKMANITSHEAVRSEILLLAETASSKEMF